MQVTDFSRFVLPEVPGCPEPLLVQEVVQTAFEFCDKTGAWNELQDPVALLVGVADYEIDAPSGAIPLRVTSAWLNGRLMQPTPLRSINQLGVAGSEPYYYNAAVERGSIRLFPSPGVTGLELTLKTCFAPAMTATTLPDFLMQRYTQVIAAGAKASLMSKPGQPWSNPHMAAVYGAQFASGMNDARAEVMLDQVAGNARITPRRFA
jgi:hypothetical protein